jgi:hypothetical protein
MPGHTVTLTLLLDEAMKLLQPRGGKNQGGGMQYRYRKWKQALDPVTFRITLDEDDLLFIRRTIPNWRNGGYQAATKQIFERPLREHDLEQRTAW